MLGARDEGSADGTADGRRVVTSATATEGDCVASVESAAVELEGAASGVGTSVASKVSTVNVSSFVSVSSVDIVQRKKICELLLKIERKQNYVRRSHQIPRNSPNMPRRPQPPTRPTVNVTIDDKPQPTVTSSEKSMNQIN